MEVGQDAVPHSDTYDKMLETQKKLRKSRTIIKLTPDIIMQENDEILPEL